MPRALRITCSICGKYFNPVKIRRDGQPTGISLQLKNDTWLHACHDCICDEQQYRKLLERVNGQNTKRNYKKAVPVCRDPMCIDECACFAAYRDGHKVLCSALNNTDFKNKWCPFFKTREQVLKEDPRYYERGL